MKEARDVSIHRKIIVREPDGGHRIYVDAQARTFSRLAHDAHVDTADICAIFDCSLRTVYRWIEEERLRWDLRVGREYLFKKDDVLDFLESGLPEWGRPPRRRR